ncbi:MAG: EAL domain-containing protein [Hydrogenovibrio sp.]|uniref:EAL and HDOD domain-containing protein n=1 Tax=Hydrogenovibrio sp. TaxID=2065821 RepID=UPI0028709388|nr:EAL domain-containing protein [Hydrogenovibrio sp.]MDR9498290.1 EAL domain-containing protein [Hydrogenovibrio sp.]
MTQLTDIFLGRQPIFRADQSLYGFELLFRSAETSTQADFAQADAASAQVMINLFGELGVKEVVGSHKAFINLTEELLTSKNRPFFPRDQVVIEVLEDAPVSPALLSSLKALRDHGYRLALDDYIFNPELAELEAYADIIKVDILQVGPKQLKTHAARLKSQGVRLLAEKVETREQFEFCQRLGFDFYQGYFFAKPQLIQGKSLAANKLTLVQLLAQVNDPDVALQDLSRLISQDVSLSHKILRLASNTSAGKVESIHQAVLQFGLNRLQSWVSLLAMTQMDDKPPELMRTALIRARFCEIIGRHLQDLPAETFFTIGLFSVLDAMMDLALPDVLSQLNLDDRVMLALLDFEGEAGRTLKAALAIEQGNIDFERPGDLAPGWLSQRYLEAMAYANGVMALAEK